jgi:hypothetical protein
VRLVISEWVGCGAGVASAFHTSPRVFQLKRRPMRRASAMTCVQLRELARRSNIVSSTVA